MTPADDSLATLYEALMDPWPSLADSRATEAAIRYYFEKNLHIVAGCAHGGCQFSADPCLCRCHVDPD